MNHSEHLRRKTFRIGVSEEAHLIAALTFQCKRYREENKEHPFCSLLNLNSKAMQ